MSDYRSMVEHDSSLRTLAWPCSTRARRRLLTGWAELNAFGRRCSRLLFRASLNTHQPLISYNNGALPPAVRVPAALRMPDAGSFGCRYRAQALLLSLKKKKEELPRRHRTAFFSLV